MAHLHARSPHSLLAAALVAALGSGCTEELLAVDLDVRCVLSDARTGAGLPGRAVTLSAWTVDASGDPVRDPLPLLIGLTGEAPGPAVAAFRVSANLRVGAQVREGLVVRCQPAPSSGLTGQATTAVSGAEVLQAADDEPWVALERELRVAAQPH